MRLLTHVVLLFISMVPVGACVGTPDGGMNRPGRGDDTGKEPSGSCQWVTRTEVLAVISSPADFAKLGAPASGCWDYNGNIRLEGAALTSVDKLGDLRGVNDLEIVDTGLTVWNTPNAVRVYGSLVITSNAKLTGLNNLVIRKFEPIDGTPWPVEYTIADNASLTTVDALKNISEVDGDLDISKNPLLQTLTFPSLERAAVVSGTRVRITDNNALTSVDLGRITAVGTVELARNAKLTSFTPPSVTAIEGDLVLRGNRTLSTIGPMSFTSRIDGALIIDDNDALVSLDDMAALRHVASNVTVTNNAQLATIAPIARLDGTGATVTIINNPALPTCLANEVAGCAASSDVSISGNRPKDGSCRCWCESTARHRPH